MRAPWMLAGAGGALIGGLALWSIAAARRAEAMVPRDGGLIEVNGDTLHYVEQGPKVSEGAPPILMIHGLAAQLRSFARERWTSSRPLTV